MADGLVVELFGGPGGWSEGLRLLGMADIAIELDAAACETRAAAGHRTIRADVARLPLAHLAGPVEGLIASPPCPMFSSAGKGAGRAVMAELATAIADALGGRPTLGRHRRAMARRLGDDMLTRHHRLLTRAQRSAIAWEQATQSALTVQPARWIAATRPRWIALEQVPAVLPLWHAYARHLRAKGYSAWAGILNAADFGVPQTRQRAFLLASVDQAVTPPTPTHAKGGDETLFGTLHPWVSMAAALGWTGEDEPARTLCGDRSPRWLYPDRDGTHGRIALRGGPQANATVRDPGEPAPTILASADNGGTAWVVRTGNNSMVTGRTADDVQRYERPVTEPAPTLDTKVGTAWTLHTNRNQQPDGSRQTVTDDRPAPALTAKAGGQWAWDRPATTVVGDPRLSGPGRNDPEQPGSQYGENSVRLTLAEALILQSFPADYPVQGTKTKQFEQVGNAVPPLLAAHVIAAVTGATGRLLQALEAAA